MTRKRCLRTCGSRIADNKYYVLFDYRTYKDNTMNHGEKTRQLQSCWQAGELWQQNRQTQAKNWDIDDCLFMDLISRHVMIDCFLLAESHMADIEKLYAKYMPHKASVPY